MVPTTPYLLTQPVNLMGVTQVLDQMKQFPGAKSRKQQIQSRYNSETDPFPCYMLNISR